MSSIIPTIITVADILELAPGADPTMDNSTINPYLKSAHKAVASIIGLDVFAEITSSNSESLKFNLKTAVANRLMYDYKLFETIQKRQVSSQNTYKYELEAMQNTYLSFYFDALDSLMSELESLPDDEFKSWTESEANKLRDRLLIKSTSQFNACYGIDNSDYFFFSTIFLQQTVIDKNLAGLDVAELADDRLRRLKNIVAKLTVAYALRQFDITMLPKSMRNSTADGASRQSSSEQDAMYKLSVTLFDESSSDLAQLMFEINTPDVAADVQSTNNVNTPNSKFFVLS